MKDQNNYESIPSLTINWLFTLLTYSVILMGSSEGWREWSSPGHGMGRCPRPLVQVRIIRLVHHFRTTHYIHIHIANPSTSAPYNPTDTFLQTNHRHLVRSVTQSIDRCQSTWFQGILSGIFNVFLSLNSVLLVTKLNCQNSQHTLTAETGTKLTAEDK